MASRLFPLLVTVLLLPLLTLSAASKKTIATVSGENQDTRLTVTLYLEPAEVKDLVGSDLGGHYIVADVKVEPKYGKSVSVDRNDFKLFSEKDSDKATPYVASQIAGRSSIIVGETGGDKEKKARPSFSLGGMMGAGGAGSNPSTLQVKGQKNGDTDESPLEKTLTEKMLPEKKSDQPVTGLLYFPMEKQKMKDLQIIYGDHENRITLHFK
jgi:hypothetical protein